MQTIGKAQVIAQAWEDSLLGRIPKKKKIIPNGIRIVLIYVWSVLKTHLISSFSSFQRRCCCKD